MKQQIEGIMESYIKKRKQTRVFKIIVCLLSCIVCVLTIYAFSNSAMTQNIENSSEELLNKLDSDKAVKSSEELLNKLTSDKATNSLEELLNKLVPSDEGLINTITYPLNNTINNNISNTITPEAKNTSSSNSSNTITPEAKNTSSSNSSNTITPEAKNTLSSNTSNTITPDTKSALSSNVNNKSSNITPTAKTTSLGDSSTAVPSLGLKEGISFKLFNYEGTNAETGVNDNGGYDYFTFHNSAIKDPASSLNYATDEPEFNDNHATVLPNLSTDGYPVFDARTGNVSDNFSLGYLFGAKTNARGEATKGVTEYTPKNTLLQKETVNSVEYYYYDSALNAVDYDTTNNKFIVRNYTERNSALANFSTATNRAEFFPFTYRTSTELITHPKTNIKYNYDTSEVDYWFGMTMDANFYMPKNGELNNQDMTFSFSGDDDVYVFIDDVLVLDIGGSHGTVDGTINFATGYVETYLNWDGVDGRYETPADGTKRHYTTSIYDSFVEAGKADKIEWVNTEYLDTKENVTKQTKTFADYSNHTIKFFYLERGASVSNCKIRFNMPILPQEEPDEEIGVILPETGSSSELIMILVGIVLMIVPIAYKIYLYCHTEQRRGL